MQRLNPDIKEKRDSEAKAAALRYARYLKPTMAQHKENVVNLQKDSSLFASWIGNELPHDFEWAFLYELTWLQLLAAFVYSMGMGHLLKVLIDEPTTPEQVAELVEQLENISDDDVFTNWENRPDHEIDISDVLACIIALNHNLICFSDTNRTINQFVAHVREGNSESAKLAVLYDTAAIYTPTIARCITRHILDQDNQFLKSIAKDFRIPEKASMKRNLRLALHLIPEQDLEGLTGLAKEKLFIEELGLHNSDQKSLCNEIKRWIAKKASSNKF